LAYSHLCQADQLADKLMASTLPPRLMGRQHGSGSGSGIPWQNGCLQQIAANRFSIPQDVIAILLQGFVRHVLYFLAGHVTSIPPNDLDAFPRHDMIGLSASPTRSGIGMKG
jgi:hypothetical protein